MEVIKCSNLEDVKREFNESKAKENEFKMKKLIPRGILVEAAALSKSYIILLYYRAYS
jgi:hypothetical protein